MHKVSKEKVLQSDVTAPSLNESSNFFAEVANRVQNWQRSPSSCQEAKCAQFGAIIPPRQPEAPLSVTGTGRKCRAAGRTKPVSRFYDFERNTALAFSCLVLHFRIPEHPKTCVTCLRLPLSHSSHALEFARIDIQYLSVFATLRWRYYSCLLNLRCLNPLGSLFSEYMNEEWDGWHHMS